MLKKPILGLVLLFVILLSSCDQRGYNEFLPDHCKTYNQFINYSSKEFYNALLDNKIKITKNNYFDVIAETKELTIVGDDLSKEFDLKGIECFQYLNSVTLEGAAIKDITALKSLTRVESVTIDNTRIDTLYPLTNMVKITSLTVNNTRTLQDLKGIETLTRLETVDLSSNSLSNIDKIQGLPNIESLTLKDNELESIDILETLPKLVFLDVEKNKISFDTKESFEGFKQLKILNLKENLVYDTKALGSFVNLLGIDLSKNNLNNRLGGTISEPDFTFLNQIKNLDTLIVEENELTSIQTLADVDLSKLTHLNFNKNAIQSIDPIIQNNTLKNLTDLYLNDNQISSISNINNLSSLTIVKLNNNKNLENIDDLFDANSLKEIYLSNNSIKEVPSLVGKLPSAEKIILSNNLITELNEFKDHEKLIEVDLSNNLITQITQSFSNMPNLKKVSLTGSLDKVNVISIISHSFNDVPNLTFQTPSLLKLNFPTANLSITESFQNLPQFLEVDFEGVQIASIDEASFKLANVTKANFNSTQISHVKWMNNLPKLEELYANDNIQLTLDGFIPTVFSVKELYLNNNNISDTSALNAFNNLEILHLNNNEIVNISFLNNKTKLKYITLQANYISDSSSIKDLPVLEELYLNANQITILSGLTNLPKLTKLNISGNEITKIDGLSKVGLTTLDLQPFPISEITSDSLKENQFKKLELQGKNLMDIQFARNLTYIEELNLNGVSSGSLNINPLANLTNLKKLYLNNNGITNIDALEKLSSLRTLSLSTNAITTNSHSVSNNLIINKFSYLTELYLDNNPINELSGLNDLTSLENITLPMETTRFINVLNEANSLESINGYSLQEVLMIFTSANYFENSFNMKGLQYLSFPNYILNYGSNITITKSFTYVKQLDFYNTYFTNSNINFINDMKNLESLNFSQNYSITALTNIDQLPKLKTVIFNNSGITNISSSFNNCTELTTIDIGKNNIHLVNSFNSPKVTKLVASGSKFVSTNSFINLTTIELSNLNNDNLSYLENLTKLTSISILNSQFSTLEFNISNLKSLTTINLTNTYIANLQNSFNNSTSVNSVLLGSFGVINNSFNNLTNLNSQSKTLTFNNSAIDLQVISSFNQSTGYNSVMFTNHGVTIKNSFNNTAISNLDFSQKHRVTELSGFNNTKLDNLEFKYYTNLDVLSGFENVKFKKIELVNVKSFNLSNVNKSMITTLSFQSIMNHRNEIISLVNGSTNLTSLTLMYSETDIDWLNETTLNKLTYISIMNANMDLYAAKLADKTSNQQIEVHGIDTMKLRTALYTKINQDTTYYNSLVPIVSPGYSGDTNNESLKTKVVDYLMKRYIIL